MAFRVPKTGGPSAAPSLAPMAQAASVAAPEIIEMQPAPVTPSLLVIGDSGTGKSFLLSRILQSMPDDTAAAVIGVENKMQQLLKYNPLIIPVGGTNVDPVTRHQQLVAIANGLANGKYREHKGKRIGVILLDGLIEVGDIIHAAMKKQYSRQKSLIMWDEVAEAVIAFCGSLRDAAGTPKAVSGYDPIPIVATVGEQVEEIGGQVFYQPLLPGRKSLKRLHYPFECVWRLETGNSPDGERQFRIHTVGTEQFKAKSPAGLFPPCVIGTGVGVDEDDTPDGGKMYQELVAWYQ